MVRQQGPLDVAQACDYIQQVAAGQFYTLGVRSDGSVVAAGNHPSVGGWSDIRKVAAGEGHAVGLRSDGTVVAVGLNSHRQCDVEGWSDIRQVAAGHSTIPWE